MRENNSVSFINTKATKLTKLDGYKITQKTELGEYEQRTIVRRKCEIKEKKMKTAVADTSGGSRDRYRQFEHQQDKDWRVLRVFQFADRAEHNRMRRGGDRAGRFHGS